MASSGLISTKDQIEHIEQTFEFFVNRPAVCAGNEAETTPIVELLNRYLQEYPSQKRGAGPEAFRIQPCCVILLRYASLQRTWCGNGTLS